MSALWDALGVLAVLAAVALPIGVAMLLAAVDDERWWKRTEREHRENAKW